MLGGSLRSRLLRGVGGSRGQFGARGVREGGAAMAAGESMAQRMVWVDLEMTGLDIEKDQIIEMACLITDSDLNILAEGPNLIIKQPDELLDSMSDWCKEHHGKSGLTKAVKESTMTLQQAEYEFLSFVRQQTPPGLCPLADAGIQKNMNLHQRRLLLTGHLMTLVKASKNFSFTEITSSRKKQMKRRGKL
ncbi:oligoribonuclease, mitochondrial isoform X2 [Rousettus aegyptiacus]|uniref:oligoribonuclease, mitochondrial isoform X2 n=1 Tax=Rousettus aegyptiacus TaxID=9407 RepID=UPI000787792D|nr:oligoribonuclease, mitochondrial isoform X2 [Rousettus aegyptiacus]